MAALVAVGLVAAPSAAQAPPKSDAADKDRAQRIFNEAVVALDEKKTDIACPKLEEVIRLVPGGIGARITLGECYEAAGKLASAWGQYVAAEAMATNAKDAERAKEAAAKAAEIKPRLATLTIEVPDAVRKTSGLVIVRDGTTLVEAQWWTPLPVDKGSHTIVVSAPGRKAWTGKVEIAKDGDKMSLSVPPLEVEAPLGQASTTVGTTSLTATSAQPRSKIPGFVLGGIGVAGLIAGGAMLGVGLSSQDQNFKDAPKDDKGNPLCGRKPLAGEDPRCADLRSRTDSANLLGNTGIGLLVGGGVLAAAGVIYLLIPSKRAPDTKSASLVPVVDNKGAGLIFKGAF